MLAFYERHATPISAAEAQRLLDMLGLPQLPYPQQQQQAQQKEQQQKEQQAKKEQQRQQQQQRPPAAQPRR